MVAHPLLDAVRPLADAIGGRVVEAADLDDGDIPLEWGERSWAGSGSPPRHVTSTGTWGRWSASSGAPLAQLDREDKQRAVKLLNDRGAFGLRRSVEQVAEAMGVSRFTVYNYLNRSNTLSRSNSLNRPEVR